MQTRLTEMLQIEHPVMLAGMGGVSYHEVVAAVSDAGGFGCLGASAMSNDRLVAEMAGVRERTDRGFGVDLLTAMPGDMANQVRLLIEGGATLFVAGLGIPRDVIDLCHDNNVLVGSMCGKVRHAIGADSLGYISEDGMIDASGQKRDELCAATPARLRRWRSSRRWSTRSATGTRSSPRAASSTGGVSPRR